MRGRGEGGSFGERYVANPWLAYPHIVPGVLYLIGAPLQLSRRFRSRHFAFHRRFGRVLIRAFAVGLGVGTIRIWVGLFALLDLAPLQESFAPAFWLGLSMHVLAAEAWLWCRPNANGRPRTSVLS